MNNSDIFKKIQSMEGEWLQRINQLTTLSPPNTEHFNLIQEHSSITSVSRISEIIKSTQIPAALYNTLDTINAAYLHKSLYPFSIADSLKAINQLNHPTYEKLGLGICSFEEGLNHISTINSKMLGGQISQHLTIEFASKQLAILNSLASSATLYANLAGFRNPLFPQATFVWEMASNSLLNRIQDIGLFSQREMLSARLFEVPNAFAEFVSHTADRLADNPTPNIAARLHGSLNLAEYQLLQITGTFSPLLTVPEDNDEPDLKRTLNVPLVQQNELLNYEFDLDENDAAELTNASSTAQIQQMAKRILELVAECNEAGKTSQLGMEFFKPTTRLLTVFIDFQWIAATDKFRFGDLIDCLYFIFYEGAGRDKLRFLEEHGGPLSKDKDCDLIWCIKHLRNKWIRHDPDHGNPKDIQKSWSALAQNLQWLGLANHPTNADFQVIQYKLLELAEEFLLRILSRLSLKY